MDFEYIYLILRSEFEFKQYCVVQITPQGSLHEARHTVPAGGKKQFV